MKKGGLLDGFPLYLLAGSRDNGATVILDSAYLGRPQMIPVPEGCRTIFVLSDNWQSLEKTREALKDFAIGKTHFLLANPERLPFRDRSVQGIVRLSSRSSKTGRRVSGKETLSPGLKEIERILKNNGWTIEILPKPIWQAKQDGEKPVDCSEVQLYYVRPSFGPEYFVTKAWTPSPWPFKFLQLGRFTSIRICVDLLISRMRIRPLYDSISIVVRSKTHGRGFLERWNGTMASGGKDRTSSPSQSTFGLYVRSNWNALFFGFAENSEIVKFPLSLVTNVRMKSHSENIEAMYADGNSVPRKILPEIVDQGIISGQGYWTEELCKGASSAKWQWIPTWKRKVAEAGFHFLIDLHRSSSQPVKIHRDLFNDLLKPHVSTVEEEARKLDPAFCLSPLVEALWRAFRDKYVPLVRTHGDFWPGNIILSERGKLAGVLDWDASVPSGWPMLDLLHFIAYQNKRQAIWHFGSVVTGKLMPSRLSRWEHMIVRNYCATLSIDSRLFAGFVALYWIERVSQWIQTDLNAVLYSDKWLMRNAVKPLPQILKQTEAIMPKSLSV